jgi:hypothetical protein
LRHTWQKNCSQQVLLFVLVFFVWCTLFHKPTVAAKKTLDINFTLQKSWGKYVMPTERAR